MSRFVRRARVWAPAIVSLLLGATPAVGQTVTVRVVHAETAEPLVGALVYLSSEAGTVLARSLTDERGRALFFQRGAGVQRVRAEMIGMSTEETRPFQARPTEAIHHDLALDPSPILLEGLSVEAEQRCRTGPAEGLTAARVWDEARKALTAAAITDEQSLYRYRTMLYEQDLDRETRLIRRSRQSQREASMRTPFRSRPVDELMQHGFVERSGAVDLYLAPDAHVLLSDAFLDAHCFRARSGGSRGETAGLVGLTFEPTAERSHLVEVAGTLWLDPATAELRWLEYRYVNLDPEVQTDELGGRVEFRRMPDGGWIVPLWWIRMPRMALQRTLAGDRIRGYVAGFREAGGRVLDVQGPGRPLAHSLSGALEGVVEDSLGRPLPGVRVDVVGSELEAVTDSAGSFAVYGLVEGLYELRFADPTLELLGYPPATLTRAVVDGESTWVEIGMPSARALLEESCAAVPPLPEWQELAREAPSTGIVFGWVLDAQTDEPVSGATVEVMTPTVDFLPGRAARRSLSTDIVLGGVHLNESEVLILRGSLGLRTTTDERGFYRVCGVPERHPVRVRVTVDGAEVEATELRIAEDGGVREVTARAPRPRRE